MLMRMMLSIVFILSLSPDVWAVKRLPILTIQGVVNRVVDGDTLFITTPTAVEKVRLEYIDAPESKQTFGKDSTAHLKGLVEGKSVSINYTGKDKYGRIVGVVILNGVCINKLMVSDGYAWAYSTYATKEYDYLQETAKASQIGLWKPELNTTCEPWNFRLKKCK